MAIDPTVPSLEQIIAYARTYLRAEMEEELAFTPPDYRDALRTQGEACLAKLDSTRLEVFYAHFRSRINYCGNTGTYMGEVSTVIGFSRWQKEAETVRIAYFKQIPGIGAARVNDIRHLFSLRMILEDPQEFNDLQRRRIKMERGAVTAAPLFLKYHRAEYVPPRLLREVYAELVDWADGDVPEPWTVRVDHASFHPRDIDGGIWEEISLAHNLDV